MFQNQINTHKLWSVLYTKDRDANNLHIFMPQKL